MIHAKDNDFAPANPYPLIVYAVLSEVYNEEIRVRATVLQEKSHQGYVPQLSSLVEGQQVIEAHVR
jgi:hypothetical protein